MNDFDYNELRLAMVQFNVMTPVGGVSVGIANALREKEGDDFQAVIFRLEVILNMKLYKSLLSVLLCVLVFIPTYSYAEMKVGIVNLGRLLNEVPMYTEAREKIKNSLILVLVI